MSENSFLVTGGTALHGSVRIGGAKNASYKLMIASLLGSEESRILNFSQISDVALVAKIISYLGGSVQHAGERALFINPSQMNSFIIDKEHGEQGRFSSMFIPALLHRFGRAVVPFPGGDKIGKRSLERHFEGLQALGAKISFEDGMIHAQAERLKGTTYTFVKNTHTGTETILMAAVLAEGTTIINNAAEEVEVDDLISYLNAMGAQIERLPGRVIKIEGVAKLGGAIHKIMPDQNEAVSYACAAIATKGDVIIENAHGPHLQAFLDKLEEIGAGIEVGTYGIRFYYKQPLVATNVTTQIAPGFKTDWQPLWATLMTQCQGKSVIHETILEKRFQYVPALQSMGAHIELFNPPVSDPENVYNFNISDDDAQNYHAIKISGLTPLKAGTFDVVDLRHGATLIIAAMIAQGTSLITNIAHVDRGYERLDEKLRAMGADIKRQQEV